MRSCSHGVLRFSTINLSWARKPVCPAALIFPSMRAACGYLPRIGLTESRWRYYLLLRANVDSVCTLDRNESGPISPMLPLFLYSILQDLGIQWMESQEVLHPHAKALPEMMLCYACPSMIWSNRQKLSSRKSIGSDQSINVYSHF